MIRIAFSLAFILLGQSAYALDICEAVAIYDVPSEADPAALVKRGEFDGAITQYNVDKKTGFATLCSHGGLCYPTHVRIDGKMVEALILTNCRPGKVTDNSADEVEYMLEPIRERLSPKDLKVYDISDQLMARGLVQVDADQSATALVYRPQSKCARVTALVLRGNKAAADKLESGDDIGCDKVAEGVWHEQRARLPQH